jgi:uncharacterized damage-inducible protein DinB
METTNYFYDAYSEARTRLSINIDALADEDLKKTLQPSPNSIGFLMRHIGDVELLFSKNVFNYKSVQVKAQTVIDQKDTGVWLNILELKEYLTFSFEKLLSAIAQQDDQSWIEQVVTKEFGSKTKSEAFGRIISHTAYHAGQIAIIRKYGK